MNIFNVKETLPPGAELVFSGSTFNDARLEAIAFHGGIVAIQHGIEVPSRPDDSPLSRAEETALGMGSIGMTRNAAAHTLHKSEGTIARQMANTLRKLDITQGTHGARTAAVHRAFELEIFDIQCGITPIIEMPDPDLLIHLSKGGTLGTFIPTGSEATDYDAAWFEVRRARRKAKLRSAEALMFYSHLAGWLPLQTELES